MKQRGLALIIGLLLMAAAAVAQPTASIDGMVVLEDNNPAPGATVRLDCYIPPCHATVQTGDNGSYEVYGLEVGTYYISAMLMGEGFSFASCEVGDEDTMHVIMSLVLPIADTLTSVYVHGTTIIEPPNESHSLPWYFVDNNNDQIGDYRLCFGPSWYDPPYVDRPANGSEVAVEGGMFSYASQPMIIVYSLADSIWRDPESGHGGFGGSQGFLSLACVTLDTSGTSGLNNPVRAELKGSIMIDACDPDTITPPGVFEFLTNDSLYPFSHHLNFGMDRPVPFDLIDSLFVVVGGLVEVPDDQIPWVIVYEVDGIFWREPGDTTGLAPMGGQAAHDPLAVSPSSFLLSVFPNPFNAATTLSYTLPVASEAVVRVFDITGREVDRFALGRVAAGSYTYRYAADHLSSGIYFAQLETLASIVTRKLVILK